LATLHDYLVKPALTIFNALGLCLQGMFPFTRADMNGLPLLRRALTELRKTRFDLRYPAYLGALPEDLVSMARWWRPALRSRKHSNGQSRMKTGVAWSGLLRIKGELF
jgi:hypothetical protein